MKLRITALGGKPEWDDMGNIDTNWKYIDSFDIELTEEQAQVVRNVMDYPEFELKGRPA